MADHFIKNTLEQIAWRLVDQGRTLGTAESCTGGLISAWITSLPGSSAWFKGGVVSYANEVKSGLLKVPDELLATHGAVSEPVALRMAEGALAALGVDYSLAVTGIAGPDGGSPEKPVGTVWIAWAGAGQVIAKHYLFAGTRQNIREQAMQEALRGLLELASDK